MLRLIFVLLLCPISVIDIHASTIKFLHDEDVEVKMQDPVYPEVLNYSPAFLYPTATIFQVAESAFNFYLVSFNSNEYYLWVEDLSKNIEIDLSNPEIRASSFVLISKSNWLAGVVGSNNLVLEKLNKIDLFYKNALDSINSLAQHDDKFRVGKDFNTVVWDSRSAKRLYNLAVEEFSYQLDEKWIHYIPSYANYWQMMYKLYYQYYHTNSFKGQNINEVKSTIESDFNLPELDFLVFHHFFRDGLTLKVLKENHEFLKGELNFREKNLAEAFIQRQAVKDLSSTEKIDFLFGIDIDAAMEGYFARDSSEKKNVLVFWSTWDSNMDTEFNILGNVKKAHKKHYNFIHICIDAYESPEKTKSFIYQNRVGGFHLLPEQSSAFRKSNFRKNQKIRDFPLYVITDNNGIAIETETVPLEISNRLAHKLKYFDEKK